MAEPIILGTDPIIPDTNPISDTAPSNPIPSSVLDMQGPFFGTTFGAAPENPEFKLENALTNLDYEGLSTYLKRNPAAWADVGYAPANVKNLDTSGLERTYNNPNDALARYVYEQILEEPEGSYDFMFGPDGERPSTPETALAAMSQYRNVSFSDASREQAPRDFLLGTAALAMGTAGVTFGAPALLAGSVALLGTVALDAGFRIFSPDSPINQPYLPGTSGKTGALVSSITAGSVPMLAAPWTIPARTRVNLGAETLARNLERWIRTDKTTLSNAAQRLDQGYAQTMSDALVAPRTFINRELSSIGTSAIAGGFVEEYAPEEMGGWKTALGLSGELLAPSFIRPVDTLIKVGENLYKRAAGVIKPFGTSLTSEGRASGFFELLVPAMVEAKNIQDPQEAQAYILSQIQRLRAAQEGVIKTPTGELNAQGKPIYKEDFPITSGLATDDPILSILEARLVRANPEISGTYSANAAFRNQVLRELSSINDNGALELRAEYLLKNQEDILWQSTVNSLTKYEETRQKLVASGDPFDEGTLFQDFFLNPDNGLFADLSRQRRLLRQAIPTNVKVDDEALGFLITEFERIKTDLSVGDQAPRLSYGTDLVSLDAALKGLQTRVAGDVEGVEDAAFSALNLDLAKVEETLANSREQISNLVAKKTASTTEKPFSVAEQATLNRLNAQLEIDKRKADLLLNQRLNKAEAPAEEAKETTTGELLTLLSTLDSALTKAAKPGSNPVHVDSLDSLRTTVLNILRITGDRELASNGVDGVNTKLALTIQDYTNFEQASNNVFAGAFLGDLKRGNFSPEKSMNAMFEATANTTAVRLQQLDEAVNLLNTFNLENENRPLEAVIGAQETRLAALEGMSPDQRAYAERLEQSIDEGQQGTYQGLDRQSTPAALAELEGTSPNSIFTQGQLQKLEDLTVNPADHQLSLRGMQRRLLRGLLKTPSFFERTPRLNQDGIPMTKKGSVMGDDGEYMDVDEPVYNYAPTAKFQSFLEENEKPLKEFFGSIYADMLDVNKLNENFQTALGVIPTVELRRSNAFFDHMLEKADKDGVSQYRQPNALITAVIGTPGIDEQIQRPDAPVVFRQVVNDMLSGVKDDEDITRGFLQAIYNNAFIHAGGTATGGEINPKAYFDYLFEPINGIQTRGESGRVPSVMNILVDEGVIMEAERLSIRRTLEALKQIEVAQQGSQGRFPALGNKTVEELTTPETLAGRTTQKADNLAASFLLSTSGSALGTTVYTFLTGGISGPGSITAAASGQRALRSLFEKLPLVAQERLFLDLFQNPEMMALGLESYNSSGKLDEILTGKKIKTLYSWFTGAGLEMGQEEFYELFGTKQDKVLRREERTESGVPPMIPRTTNPRRVAPNIVPPAEQAPPAPAPVPLAQAAPPMAPPAQQVAQAPASAAQAPASPDQRARYAAMFPNDMASGIIRQGIGSLG